MKILIADDVSDLAEVLALMVQGIYPGCEILLAFDGAEAIHLIEQNSDIDLVLSDFNMPQKNGGEVYQFLRQKNSYTPFLLISTVRPQGRREFDQADHFATLAKPFTDEELEKVLKTLIKTPSQSDDSLVGIPSDRAYVPVHIQVLRKIHRIEAPLFLKLSESNFVKVLHPGAQFDDAEFQRFAKKGTDKLWIEFFNYGSFILNYKKEILSREAWKELEDAEAAHALAIDHEVVLGAGKSFGWSNETVQLAVENIKQVSKLLERNPDLKEIAQRLSKENYSRLSTLSVLLAVACVAILQELGWASEVTRQKLTFAALLHDMELDEDLLATLMTLLSQDDISEYLDDPSLKAILEHPIHTAETLVKWPLCPPDVDVIIRQHHERPDGKGFPFGLDAMRISPLAAVLIIAEDMIFHTLDNMGGDPKSYLMSKKQFYSRGEFKKIFDAAIRSLA